MDVKETTVQYIKQEPGISGMKRAIERAARICMHSQDKMTDDSYKEFIQRQILTPGHGRALEFGTCFLKVPDMEHETSPVKAKYKSALQLLLNNEYTKSDWSLVDNSWYITTNYRVIMQGFDTKWGDAISSHYAHNIEYMLNKYWCEPTERHFHRYLVEYHNVGRGVADELRTHTHVSTLMQSTRYCKYSSPKFGQQLDYACTEWTKKRDVDAKGMVKYFNENNFNGIHDTVTREQVYYLTLRFIEEAYMALTAKDDAKFFGANVEGKPLKAEEARGVLCLDKSTDMVQCGFVDDWDDLFRQRLANDAHPDAQHVAKLAYDEISKYLKVEKLHHGSNNA